MNISFKTIKFPILAIFLLISCGNPKEKKEQEENQEELSKTVKVELVSLSTMEQSKEYTAVVQSNKISKIMPAMPGRIRKIAVDVGDKVSKGQVLALLDDASLMQQKTRLENLEKDFERFDELYKVGGISKQQLDQMEAQLSVARSAYANLKENTSLISPINGVVTASNFEQGDMVAQLPILIVENYNPVKLLINLEESLFAQIKKGKEVNVRLDVYPDRKLTGKVSLIHPTIAPGSHTFSVEIEIENAASQIRPGMFARVSLPLGTQERILVNDGAVMKQTGSNAHFVYLVKNGAAESTDIVIGRHLGDKYEIISGLSEGDSVITTGASRLSEKDKIKIVN